MTINREKLEHAAACATFTAHVWFQYHLEQYDRYGTLSLLMVFVGFVFCGAGILAFVFLSGVVAAVVSNLLAMAWLVAQVTYQPGMRQRQHKRWFLAWNGLRHGYGGVQSTVSCALTEELVRTEFESFKALKEREAEVHGQQTMEVGAHGDEKLWKRVAAEIKRSMGDHYPYKGRSTVRPSLESITS